MHHTLLVKVLHFQYSKLKSFKCLIVLIMQSDCDSFEVHVDNNVLVKIMLLQLLMLYYYVVTEMLEQTITLEGLVPGI